MNKFNAEKTKENLVKWIKEWFDKNSDNGNAIIGISGGKDSTVVAGLCVEALGKDRVIGVLMPNGTQSDIQDSYNVVNNLGIIYHEINIKNSYDAILNQIKIVSEQTRINLAPRLRMSVLYAVAQSNNGRVVNTSNMSEYMAGYFTKFGDNCGDLFPLINLTKSEVVEIGLTLNFPEYLVTKAPSDGLTGMTDEDKLGYTYFEIDAILRGEHLENSDKEKFINNRINKTEFKRKYPDKFNDIKYVS